MDRHFFPGLGVPADPSGLVPDRECPEGRDLDLFATYKRIGHVLKDAFDKLLARGVIDEAPDLAPRQYTAQLLPG